MTRAVEAAHRDELRRAGLSDRGALARLLAVLRGAQETHLGLAEVMRMATHSGLALTTFRLAGHLETLADHGLIRRFATTTAEPVFDTDPEPHAHLVYEETTQTVDLQVSPETLLAIIRRALQQWPDDVEITIRVRANRISDDDGNAAGRAPILAGDWTVDLSPGRSRPRAG
jgi:Fur family iron response transcriptional regulator